MSNSKVFTQGGFKHLYAHFSKKNVLESRKSEKPLGIGGFVRFWNRLIKMSYLNSHNVSGHQLLCNLIAFGIGCNAKIFGLWNESYRRSTKHEKVKHSKQFLAKIPFM